MTKYIPTDKQFHRIEKDYRKAKKAYARYLRMTGRRLWELEERESRLYRKLQAEKIRCGMIKKEVGLMEMLYPSVKMEQELTKRVKIGWLKP